MSRKKESNVFVLRRPKWVKQPSARWNRREQNFSLSRRTSCLESRNQSFLGSRGRNDTNSHLLARIGEKKIFHELDVDHVYKKEIKRFWAQRAKMSLTVICSLESARRKFFMNSTYIMSRKWESNVFGLKRPKWLKQPSARWNRREENFSLSRRTSCLESRNESFLGSEGRNDSNSHLLARIGEKKIFHELDVHHV